MSLDAYKLIFKTVVAVLTSFWREGGNFKDLFLKGKVRGEADLEFVGLVSNSFLK